VSLIYQRDPRSPILPILSAAWQPNEPEWGLLYLWDRLDWISHLDVGILVATLVYVVVVTLRCSYIYRESCRETGIESRALVGDLNRRVRAFQSITTAAPYLGLAGTCFGILDSFRGIGMQRGAAIAMIAANNAASLITTASGVLVALAASGSSNYLLRLSDSLEFMWRSREPNSAAPSRLFPKYPLRIQSSKIPALALLATPSLAIALAAFMSFSAFRVPVGLDLRLIEDEPGDKPTLQPIVIRISDRGAAMEPEIRLDSKNTTWNDLGNYMDSFLRNLSKPTVRIEADESVRWAYVALVIDSVKFHSDDPFIVLTIKSNVAAGPRTKTQSKSVEK
jgi:hypothetical protein